MAPCAARSRVGFGVLHAVNANAEASPTNTLAPCFIGVTLVGCSPGKCSFGSNADDAERLEQLYPVRGFDPLGVVVTEHCCDVGGEALPLLGSAS